jgi:dolichyl-diphosphooligosaccharide--protein glycosyltransferase
MPGDDELSLDFGKVGDFFKRKKKAEKKEEPPVAQEKPAEPSIAPVQHESLFSDKHATVPHEEHAHKKQEDDSITIDFSKITKWFKGKAHAAKDAGSDKEDLTFDMGKVWAWVKKNHLLVILALLLIFQFVPNKAFIAGRDVYLPWGGMHMRLLGQDLPATIGWAQNHVHGILKGQIAAGINQQYPSLPDERKNKLIEEEWAKLYAQQGGQVEQNVQAIRQQLMAFWQYEANGRQYTYMPDIDPYIYLRYARNIVEKGHIYDKLGENGDWIDDHMIAPLGWGVTPLLHVYVMAWMYEIAHVFNPGITLMQAATYFPIVFVLLALIPAFLLGRKFSGTVGGVITATMIAVMPTIMSRTTWGHADSDTWNVIFPVLLIYLYVELIDSKNLKQTLAWGIGAGLVTGLYAWGWMGGWWYVFDFLLAAFGILVASELARNWNHKNRIKDIIRHHAVIGAAYFVSAGVFVSLFTTFWDFWNSVLQPFRFTIIKQAAHENLWPNVYTTVAELNPIDLNGIVNSLGGWWYFWIAVMGIALVLFKREDGAWKLDLKYGPLFALWMAATIYASTKGVRFTLLIAPAFAVAFGIALGRIYEWVVKVASKDFNLNVWVPRAVMIVIIAMMLSSQARTSYGTSFSDIPIMNDAWWNTLTSIKDDSKPDAIVNSWWDFGHHFKYVADRPVTFDGASQNTPMAHWIGRALSTSNETEAVGILRMLDCGSNNAFEVIDKQFNDPVKTVKLLYKIITLDKKQALAELAKAGVNEQEAVLKNTHCDPPENYFIASEDMIGKSGVWSHFGFWNFERAKLWITLKNQDKDAATDYMVKEWDYTPEKAEQTYFEVQGIGDEGTANAWISPWLGILGGASGCSVTGEMVSCGNGVMHNLTSRDTVMSVQGNTGTPPLLVRLETTGELKEYRYNNSNVGVAVLLYPSGSGYQSVLASPELIRSMFVLQYFLEGHGLRHFKPFAKQTHITGGDVVTYKLDWKGGAPNVYSGLASAQQAKADAAKQDTGAKEGDTVSVYYIGSLLDGTVFDSSIRDWKEKNVTIDSKFDDFELSPPLTFAIGKGQVIEGFDAAVRGQQAGGEQVVQIPPNAAYGFDPKAHFLGNQTLRFRIKVVDIKKK